jgi:flavin reductase (DIM6/NTAB) family NADH-FMN oxidoreductase RutF
MKAAVTIEKASRLINCSPLVLISAGYQGKNNITTCAWHMPFSQHPPSLGIALAKKHFSSKLIKESQEFVVNIPHWGMLDKVVFCGSVSGYNIDKFSHTKLTIQKAQALEQAPKIEECLATIECKLFDTKDVSDHFLFFGKIVHAEADDKYFINDFWDTSKAELILHLGSRFFAKPSAYSEFKK